MKDFWRKEAEKVRVLLREKGYDIIPDMHEIVEVVKKSELSYLLENEKVFQDILATMKGGE
ncbi:hypothetical protein [Thermodesulfovibrio yellowstonii]|jgi:hypothetical protein|uniref:Uncharacterized protein n=1 Tax=Thermodesulfovibrio yellowstonii (strain ATCC 51303 / DSM 11347 / YP87) TaxID=289376 RepID=B5YII3_THEYD|nr:hypothetical protein [Thermodesulfovibrio yellowstonii]ACI20446.1 hypothetical protein THEYE_A0294 [Thermodesulfovibrio yellowstonii DSM 11347]